MAKPPQSKSDPNAAKQSHLGPMLGGLGGLMLGVAALATFFFKSPPAPANNPSGTAQIVSREGGATGGAAARGTSVQAAAAAQSLGSPGITASLVSVMELADRFVVNLRVVNDSDTQKLLGIRA